MFGRFKLSGWLVCLLLLGLVEAVSVVGAAIVIATPAQAQFWGAAGRPAAAPSAAGSAAEAAHIGRRPANTGKSAEYCEYREYELACGKRRMRRRRARPR